MGWTERSNAKVSRQRLRALNQPLDSIFYDPLHDIINLRGTLSYKDKRIIKKSVIGPSVTP